MNVRRMRRCIKFLRELPRKRFDFGVVYCHTECGSVGCVCGYLGEMFPKLVKLVRISHPDSFNIFQWNICGKRYIHYDNAFSKLMDIDCMDAGALTTPDDDNYPLWPEWSAEFGIRRCPRGATPKQVANMLEKYMNKVLQKGKS